MAGALAFLGLWLVPAQAGAATLTPCVAGQAPTGPVIDLDGSATIDPKSAVRRKLRRGGVRLSLAGPANASTGRPAFPVTSAAYGEPVSDIGLGGALVLKGRKSKQVRFGGLRAIIRSGGDSSVTARFDGATRVLFSVKGGEFTRDAASGELFLNGGRATLSGPAAKLIKKRFGLRNYRALKKGLVWGSFDLYSLYKVTVPPEDPKGEVPEEPPVAVRPAGATDLTGASIDWRVRESFIRYISSGDGADAIDGAVPGPAEAIDGAGSLVYEFGFPFASGWIDEATDSTLVKGTGGVTFRYCRNTINFVVHDPEIELNGDLSRIIFRVQGLDGTAYPDSRAVMVGLRLSQAESVETVGKTTTYTKVPGYVPEGSAGIFADFYLPGAEFGSLTLSVTTP